jgi:hypothetical protein
MLNTEAVKTMLETGGATLADIATHFNTSLVDVHEFVRNHGIREPNLEAETLKHIWKLGSAEAGRTAEGWERLLWDDEAGDVINGIDTSRTDGNINALEILRYYHGGCRCWYTGRPTELVMAADADQSNILVSNLVPVVEEIVDERFRETPPFIVDERFTFETGVRLNVSIEHRFDRLLGRAFNQVLVEHQVERWLAPYLNRHEPVEILSPYCLPATPELLGLWVWRQLETKALMKGLARIRLDFGAWPTAYITKQALLFQTKQMLQRQFGRRSVVIKQPPVRSKPNGSRLIKL